MQHQQVFIQYMFSVTKSILSLSLSFSRLPLPVCPLCLQLCNENQILLFGKW